MYVTCGEIIESINKQYNGMFEPIEDHAIMFIHQKYGEKILDKYECPLQIIENYSESEGFFKSLASNIFTSRKVKVP